MKYFLRSLSIALTFSSAAIAQNSATTFQGELKTGNQLASGPHDFRFRLFDAASNGTQIGTGLCVDNVPVTDGKFSVVLDMGSPFHTTSARFLEFDVRQDSGLDCSNGSGFVAMGPRHPLTAAPLAQHARTAFALDAPDGSPLSAVFVDSGDRVGIGATEPLFASLNITRSDPVIVLQDPGPDATQSGYVGFWNSQTTGNFETARIGFLTPGGSTFTINCDRISGNIGLFPGPSGNVGIDTSAPLAKLDVRGDIRMGSTGQQFAIRGDENLRIIRGSVGNNGGTGTGYSVSRHADLGKYRITFSPPFAAIPAVTITPRRSVQDFLTCFTPGIDSVTTSEAIVVIWGLEINRYAYTPFDFLVVGPR